MRSLLAVLLLATACSSSSGLPVASGAALARGSLTAAELDLESGTTSVTIKDADLGPQLVAVTTPTGAGQVPVTVVDHGRVHVQLRDSGTHGPSVVDVALARGVLWTIRLEGGATDETLDLRGTKVREIDQSSGASRVDVTLPPPSGTTTFRCTGGASELTLHLVGSAPVHVHAGGGAGQVVVDGVTHAGVAGGTDLTDPAFAAAADRSDVQCDAGVSRITVDRLPVAG